MPTGCTIPRVHIDTMQGERRRRVVNHNVGELIEYRAGVTQVDIVGRLHMRLGTRGTETKETFRGRASCVVKLCVVVCRRLGRPGREVV